MQAACLAAVALLSAALAVRRLMKLEGRTRQLERELQDMTKERRAERAGRIKAERELQQLHMGAVHALHGEQPFDSKEPSGLRIPHLEPIGTVSSCFTQRNGTPRQPLLVGSARAKLTLRQGLPHDALDGLQQYSHCWILYIFHRNTNLHREHISEHASESKKRNPHTQGIKAKIRVPRLDGKTMGVLATRSPHRPVPIGLSCARVKEVRNGEVLLEGADIVDGTPVLDVKPYVPFCDSVESATAPAWVAATSGSGDEPLYVKSVQILEVAQQQIQDCWHRQQRTSLYATSMEFLGLVKEVLSRDIRSTYQRTQACKSCGIQGSDYGEAGELFHVILEGVDIAYDVVDHGVVVCKAEIAVDSSP
ncbi:unnamed protein product [Ostreobium quekettii]|uniref:TsaA-like domain-containing protein n=1 Tax=Ostreobium quekettii TaxID=121088 RepID=A0A8S1J625_9CHLO|nr:unnamed protein product [Ostreobium quekettii]